MSEQEVTNDIESETTSVDSVEIDEVEKASPENIQKDGTITVSSEKNQNPSSQTIDDSLSKTPETETSSKTEESLIKSSEKNPEATELEPSNPLTSIDHASASKEKDEENPSSKIAIKTHTTAPGQGLLPKTKIPKTTTYPKIKVLISSIDKFVDSAKELAKDSSKDSVENEKPDDDDAPTAISQFQQQEIKSSSNEAEKTTQSDEQYADHVTYTEDGTAIYVDPKTQHKYKWCPAKNDWIAFDGETTNPTANDDENEETNKKTNPYENEHYRWCSETNQWIPKNTSTSSSSSLTETEHYRWDAEKNEWIMKNQVPSLDDVTYGYEDGVRIYTDKDGMVFFWDEDKKAWFPKIDDDFLAKYQMSYGFIDNTSAPASDSVDAEKVRKEEEEMKKIELEKMAEEIKKNDAAAVAAAGGGVKRKAPPEPPKWFEVDPTQNTKVYVSNLPLDITMEEFSEIMSKCGMIMKDPQTQKQKLKLYAEKDGQLKGDGLCDYIKVESVDLALNLLDESIVRGNKIKVQRAKFQMRGEYNPSLKPKRKKKDKEKLIKMKEKLFDWRPEKMRGERSKHERTVIIKNLFTPELFDNEVQLIIEYQNDLREECSKCGTVRKVVIYDRHAEGVAQVNMADPEEADLVIQMMNGRFFGQRKLIAETWDGKTKYKVAETEEEIQARINKWDKYLEKGGVKEEEENDEDDDEISNEAIKNKSDGKEQLKVVPIA
ncbi:uncharacterized protein LOC129912777 [Episyrphus balteatus]|uniref:uncharacterized protein LOC129912777 n=1 Tax=Episyrphus balteatus TaxID=286459 RepID=UPI002485E654|nr:uncharacterized protein LOC129912777 [Episyrphus balteatus]